MATSFFLNMGSLANADEKYFKHQQPYWLLNIEHTTYDDVWQSRAVWKYLKGIKPAVMLVGGWFDTEDPQGLFRQFEFMEKNSPPPLNMLVVGPWTHGGFSRGDGDRVGNVNFGSKTGSVLPRERGVSVLPLLSERQGRRQVSESLRLRNRRQPVAQVRGLAAAAAKPKDLFPGRAEANSLAIVPATRVSKNTWPIPTSPCPISDIRHRRPA